MHRMISCLLVLFGVACSPTLEGSIVLCAEGKPAFDYIQIDKHDVNVLFSDVAEPFISCSDSIPCVDAGFVLAAPDMQKVADGLIWYTRNSRIDILRVSLGTQVTKRALSAGKAGDVVSVSLINDKDGLASIEFAGTRYERCQGSLSGQSIRELSKNIRKNPESR